MAKSVKHGLGRGLDALMGGPDAAASPASEPEKIPGDRVLEIPLTDIDPNRNQPRKQFDPEAMAELAQSIRSVGVIQPVILKASGNGRYQIISGERRFRAARMAGLNRLPAIVRDWDEPKRLEAALIENLQRDDLNPVEEARGVRELMDRCGYTQEEAAKRLGRSRPAVANLLRILTLDEKVIAMVAEGKLSAGHARSLAAVEDKALQVKLANLCISQGWSVRQMERICQNTLQKSPEEKPAPVPRPPEFKELEHMARAFFGTKASIEGDLNAGRIILNYYSQEDLQHIWELLECANQNNM